MRNIFVLYMPPGNPEAMVHYQDTIRNKVASQRIFAHVDRVTRRKLEEVFGSRPIAVWGSRDSPANRTRFDRMQEGDEILIVEGPTIRLLGRVAAKTVNPGLSRELWQGLKGNADASWALIYFIANPREITLPFAKFRSLFGYEENFQLRGFTSVAADRLESFYEQYDDLYSVLCRLQNHQPIEKVIDPRSVRETLPPEAQPPTAEPESPAKDGLPEEASDHLKMQWLLLQMGKRAGEKVWAPRGDQTRLTSAFGFADFEHTFSAGLDTHAKYVENIDVVWKEEFRIDAAFEIENSTSIYSGLLRFSDLTMVAPNTLYPLFIVSPIERRSRVREQLARPTFRRLGLARKVRYLPYEQVNEIDRFFGDRGSGLSVDVLVGKSENLSAS